MSDRLCNYCNDDTWLNGKPCLCAFTFRSDTCKYSAATLLCAQGSHWFLERQFGPKSGSSIHLVGQCLE